MPTVLKADKIRFSLTGFGHSWSMLYRLLFIFLASLVLAAPASADSVNWIGGQGEANIFADDQVGPSATDPPSELDPEIAGGFTPSFGKYGYTVRLEVKSPGDDKYQPFCSGVLIGSRYVLTAAHCLLLTGLEGNSDGLRVRFANIENRPTIAVTRSAIWRDYILDYTGLRSQFDLAVLQLSAQAPVASKSLSLFNSNMKRKSAYELGYGLRPNKRDMSKYVQKGSMLVNYSSRCGGAVYAASEICTTTKSGTSNPSLKAGACNGDSGGPLISNVNNKVIGITSWAPRSNCLVSQSKRTTVFARADGGRNWLRYQTGLSLFGLPAVKQNLAVPEAISARGQVLSKKQMAVEVDAAGSDWQATVSLFVTATIIGDGGRPQKYTFAGLVALSPDNKRVVVDLPAIFEESVYIDIDKESQAIFYNSLDNRATINLTS